MGWILNCVEFLNLLGLKVYNVEGATWSKDFKLSVGRAAWEAGSKASDLFANTAFNLH
jgi:hypothetical protein